MALPIIIDIEASGFGNKSYPIEIGFILEDKQTWCALIQPDSGWEFWDKQAESVHHISRDILEQHGKPAELIVAHLNTLLANKIVYSDGWAHDYVWLHQLYESVNQTPSFKLQDLRYILDEDQMRHWHETKLLVIEETQAVRHRASADAKIIQQTWLKTKDMTMAQQTA